MAKTHIIGAGLAGLAAAVKLITLGREVALYESAPQAGGRCRSYFEPIFNKTIDNGSHLILNANRHALSYIDSIGARDSFITCYHPRYAFMDIASGERWELQKRWALTAWGKLAFAGDTQAVEERIVSSSTLYRCFVHPFCISALNTHPAKASATLLRRTLWQMIRSGVSGLRYYLPKHSLAESLIDPAIQIIIAAGGSIHYQQAVKALVWDGPELTGLQCADTLIDTRGDTVILATPPYAAAKLLPRANIRTQANAIVNGHFLCPDIAWPQERDFIGLTGGTAQWLFYRNGILSTTTSAADTLAEQDNAVIAQLLWDDVQKALKLSLPMPPHKIICEKRATLAAIPMKPSPIQMQYGNLLLAGDYTQPLLPNTIDSAVKSGFAAAKTSSAHRCNSRH